MMKMKIETCEIAFILEKNSPGTKIILKKEGCAAFLYPVLSIYLANCL